MWTIDVKILAVVLLLVIIWAGCSKDSEDRTNPVPVIEFVSVTPGTVQEYTDSLTFTIYYRDGDGDLGENDADVKNLFLTDTRNQVTYKYRIQQLAPTGAAIPIEGNLNITLDNTAILDGSVSETVTYDIYITDRAGNRSNTVSSDEIVVTQ